MREHQHHTEVRRDGILGGWYARCDCGYLGRSNPSKRDADNDADEHVRMSAGEAL